MYLIFTFVCGCSVGNVAYCTSHVVIMRYGVPWDLHYRSSPCTDRLHQQFFIRTNLLTTTTSPRTNRTPRCCCWTSPRPRWTPRASRAWSARSAGMLEVQNMWMVQIPPLFVCTLNDGRKFCGIVCAKFNLCWFTFSHARIFLLFPSQPARPQDGHCGDPQRRRQGGGRCSVRDAFCCRQRGINSNCIGWWWVVWRCTVFWYSSEQCWRYWVCVLWLIW